MLIFSDPHLCLNRQAHTTKESRKKLKLRLNDAIRNVMEGAKFGTNICVGDLFDTFSNKEEDLIEATKAAANLDVVLAGNHDSLNQWDVKGSLEVFGLMLEPVTVIKNPEMGKAFVGYIDSPDGRLTFIPHHATQELFEKALDQLEDTYVKKGARYRAVFLHCNYENAITEGHDISLNLTKKRAEALLSFCDYVFLGHEHQPRELMDGRLIITGNIHPTSFSDISDKYRWILDADGLRKEMVWSMEESYARIEYDGKSFPRIPKEVDFIDIAGEITADQGADLTEYISQCWEESEALMIRNNVSIVVDHNVVIDAVDFHNLANEIDSQLQGTDLEEKWAYYRGQVEC